jgi:hypothetical protein
MHVHADAGHDHPEHHHGPAAHSHADDQGAHTRQVPAQRSMAACHAGDHEVLVRAASIVAKPFEDGLVALPASSSPATEVRRSIRIRHADVRVHGPPPHTPSSPRAPPVVHPA